MASGLVTSAPVNQIETAGVLGHDTLGVFGHGRSGQQYCLRHARPIDVVQFSALLAAGMEVDVEDGSTPLVGGLSMRAREHGCRCGSQELAPVKRKIHMVKILA